MAIANDDISGEDLSSRETLHQSHAIPFFEDVD